MKVAIIVLAEPRSHILATFAARFRTEPWSGAVELAARLGYVARGLVYLSVGLVALLAALGVTPHARSALGAVEALSGWTAGVALLWFIGLGLCGFALWRALQSFLDADGQGKAASGLAAHFSAIEILSEKDDAAYARVLRRHGVALTEFAMVGNSLKSDILPVLALGGAGVHVPYHITWQHEHAEEPPRDAPRFRRVERLGQLPPLLPAL